MKLTTHIQAARRIAVAVAALLFCVAADSAALAYELGRQTGQAVHERNDQLAGLFRRVLAPTPAPVATPTPAPVATPAPDFAALTVRELRTLTGLRSSRLRKADLVAAAQLMAA